MSVVKRKRKESQFEVFHHFYKVRKEMTDLLLRDFGYSSKKSEEYLVKIFGGRKYEELTEDEKKHHDYRNAKTVVAVIPEFVQPTGAHDAYNIGDKVIFEGQTYESLVDANVYSPTAYPQGWQVI